MSKRGFFVLTLIVTLVVALSVQGLAQPAHVNLPEQAQARSPVFDAIGKDVLLPPDVMPVIFISGEPYDMGYQYGQQADDYIIRVKDRLWNNLLANDDRATILTLLRKYEATMKEEIPEFIDIMRGMARGAGVDYEDILVINCFVDAAWARPADFCSGLAAWDSATPDGKTIVGINFDFMSDPFAYRVVIVAHPSFGNSYISTGWAGTLGGNFYLNEKGLVETNHHGEYVRDQDKAFGVPAFVLPAFAVTKYDTAEEARDFLLEVPKSMGVIRMLTDAEGGKYVIESTADLAFYREPGDFGEDDYLMVTNHWIMPEMDATKWPVPGPGSSQFRYLTIEKLARDNHGSIDLDTLKEILGVEDYWDGSKWHYNMRFSPLIVCGRQLTAQIAIPEDLTAYILTGDSHAIRPDGAPFSTGQYVKYTLTEDVPSFNAMVKGYALDALTLASRELNDAGYLLGRGVLPTATNLALNGWLNDAKLAYWAGLEKTIEAEKAGFAGNKNASLAAYAEASTYFSKAQAYALKAADAVK